jgi:hypothetical protein
MKNLKEEESQQIGANDIAELSQMICLNCQWFVRLGGAGDTEVEGFCVHTQNKGPMSGEVFCNYFENPTFTEARINAIHELRIAANGGVVER